MRPILNVLLRFSIYGNSTLPIVAILTMGKEVLHDQTTFEHHNHSHTNMPMAQWLHILEHLAYNNACIGGGIEVKVRKQEKCVLVTKIDQKIRKTLMVA